MKDNLGWTALHHAARNGHTAAVEALITGDADIQVKDRQGRTALHHAAANGRTKVIEVLVARGVDRGVIDNAGWTALHYASTNNHIAAVEALIAGITVTRPKDGKCRPRERVAPSLEAIRAALKALQQG